MKKQLSIRFERAVSPTTNRPEYLEIVVTPLNSASAPDLDITYLAEKQSKKILLSADSNLVTFDLTPTYLPGLSEPIFYRIAWRKGYRGRITETDFSMPSYDVDFDDLGDLGNVIDGTNYLREEDLGVPGRVARLSNEGYVLDGDGNPLGTVVLDDITAALAQEIRDRGAGDAFIDRKLTLRLETQITSVLETTSLRLATEVENREVLLSAERTQRIAGDTAITTQLNDFRNQTQATLSAHTTSLTTKADLVNGKLPTSQLPSLAVNNSVEVADEAAMLALTSTQVQLGDIAVRPDGVFMLTKETIADPDSWVALSAGGGSVTSVNGQTGIITLGPADVGARPVGAAIPLNEVTGLATALAGKASTTALGTTNANLTTQTGRIDALSTALTTLDGKAVKFNLNNEIPTSYLAADVPRVDSNNQFLRKDGTVIPIAGGGGGGEVTAVNGKTGNVVLVPADIGAVSNSALASALSTKADQSALNALSTRVSRNETDIADLIAGGGGGPGTGSSKTAITWVAEIGADVETVLMKSPFGLTELGNAPYYDPNGAAEGEAAWPYIDANGHLQLRQVQPGATPEPPPVNPAAFDTLQIRVTSLENGSAKPAGGWLRTDLEEPVQDSLDLIDTATATATADSVVRRNGLGTFAVVEPTTGAHPATKNYTDTGLATKATSASVTSLTATVATKASTASVDALTTRVTSVETTLPNKADLDVGGFVPVGQIPTLPGSKVTGFAAKADLDGGNKVPLAQIPAGIPQTSVLNLTTALNAKADLVGGLVPTNQLPALSTSEVYPVANRAAMLALTTSQVQRGDMAVITGGVDQGSYILNATDPSQFNNWVLLQTPAGSVQSVNGQSGTVVLNAADVGARSSSVAVPQADVTNLVSDLSAKAATTYVDAQVATRTTPAAVTAQIAGQSVSKLAADVAATSAVTLSGAQSIDGALRSAGVSVLLTNQPSSSQNGKWIIAAGAWTRAADQPSGSTFMPSTLVVIKSGTAHANSIWQLTTGTSGTVDTNAQAWSKVLQGGPPITYTGGDGIDVTGTTISAKTGPGLLIDSTTKQIKLDTTAVLRGMVYDVPAGSATVTIPHNLNTLNIWVCLRDKTSGDIQLIGATATSINNASIEFQDAPSTNQWAALVFGI